MHYKSLFVLFRAIALSCLFAMGSALAQTNSYKQTNLTADTRGGAPNVDPMLINPWGIAFFPNQPFWISDNNSGFSTLYNQNGCASPNRRTPTK